MYLLAATQQVSESNKAEKLFENQNAQRLPHSNGMTLSHKEFSCCEAATD